MLDKIGIIGSTQGVSESNKPATKKLAITNHKLPDFKICVVPSVSLSLTAARLALLWLAVDVLTEIVFLIGA